MYNLFANFRYGFIGTYIVSSPPLLLGGGTSRFWNLDKEGGHEKIAQK